MEKARVTRVMLVSLLVLLVAVVLSEACAKPAPAPTPSPKPAPTQAAAPKTSPLVAIIEGAKKEGTVTASLTAGYDSPKAVDLLRKAIKDKYGVDLDIKVQATSGMAGMVAKAVMETRAGAEPTYDIIGFGSDYVPRGTTEGIFETVDWRSILEPGTSPKVQYDHPQLKAGIVFYGLTMGLVYNPQKVSAADLPKKLADLADPKWKGRLGIHDYASHWARYAFMLGKERFLSDLRSIVKTRPIMDRFPPLNTRYLAGEIDLLFTNNQQIDDNISRGKPTAWRALEILELRDSQIVVMKGTKHPNAARLIGVFLAGPDGAKFTMEVVKAPHPWYAGNQLYDAVEAAKKEGIPIHTWESFPGLLDFILSPAYEEWQKEIQVVLDSK